MSSEVAAKATDSSSITETSPQPLLAPSAAVYPTFQPTPGAQPTCAHAHTHQGRSEFLASRGQLRPNPGSGRALSSAQGSASLAPALDLCRGGSCPQKTGGAAHLCSCSTLLLKDEHPPAGLPFDAARSPDATRGATPARTRMASATCPGLTLDGPRLPILGLHLAQLRGRPGRGLSLAVTRRMRSHACTGRL